MQPVPDRQQIRPSRRWRRRKTASYVKLILILIFSISIIFFGHRPGWWHSHAPNSNAPFPPTVAGRGQPIDGDSLHIGSEEVRLQGIDAPEWKQECRRQGEPWNCGEAARESLVRAIGDDRVTCAISERDVYGRMLGRCSAGGRDLNAGMVSSGMAVAYGGYWNEQSIARAERRGLWAGEFQQPRDWRAEHASDEAR